MDENGGKSAMTYRLSREEVFRRVADQQMTMQEAKQHLMRLEQAPAPTDQSPVADSFPLSEGQKALWIVHQMAPDTYAYNVPVAFYVQRTINTAALKRALQRLIDRHPCLRTVFRQQAGEPMQSIQPDQKLSYRQVEVTPAGEPDVLKRVQEEARQPFSLKEGPLFQTILFWRSPPKPHILLFRFHHLIFDGVSLQNFLQDLKAFYQAETFGTDILLTEQESTYRDYVEWQRKMLAGAEGERHRRYWQQQLRGLEPLDLHADKPRAAVATYRGKTHPFAIDAALTDRLQELALAQNQTLFTILLTAYQVLLFTYSRQEEFAVGTPMVGRPNSASESLIGYFVNMVPIRCRVEAATSFLDLVKQVHGTVLDAFEHSQYPAFLMVKESGDNSLFQATFHFQSWVKELVQGQAAGESFLLDMVKSVHQEGEFELSLEVYQQAERCELLFKYNPDRFESATIEQMARQYRQLLLDLVEHADRPISELNMLSAEEEHQVLVTWNQTAADSPELPIHKLIEEQAQQTPDSIAVIYEGQSLTYLELAERSEQLAIYLQSLGVGRGTIVGIFIEPCLEMMVALLGAMKAGATYVPFDPTSPPDRLQYMMEDTALPVLLTRDEMMQRLPAHSVRAVRLDRDWSEVETVASGVRASGGAIVLPTVSLDDIAYLIYTSGSTGKPKGVQVYHRGLTNVIWSMSESPGCTAADHVLALTTICFDIAAVELYMPLIKGGRVELLHSSYAKDGRKLRRKIEATEATIVQATPATWQMLISAEWEQKKRFKAITAGEPLSSELAEKIVERVDQFWNQYGPTENSIYTTIDQVRAGERITIGRPIHNNQLYILDESRRPVPIGVPGELYIGGHGVAKGYLNQPDLNSKSFVPNLFSSDPESKLYRTGDLVRYLPDGRVDYLGRIDQQVKLNGYRIELGEIEAVQRKLPHCQEVVVVLREDSPGHKRLVAFLVEHPDAPAAAQQQRKDALKKWLPAYMIPSSFVLLRSLPMTLSRKVDRKLLTSMSLKQIEKEFGASAVAPDRQSADEAEAQSFADDAFLQLIERDVAAIVAAVLDVAVHEIELETHFGEYGFDSIRFTTLGVKLDQKYSFEVSPALFYEFSTVRALSRYLWQEHRSTLQEIYQDQLPKAPQGQNRASRQTAYADEPNASKRAPSSERSSSAAGIEEPVAIVGIAGSLPNSSDLGQFWEHLKAGHHLVEEIPPDRWDWREFFGDPTKEDHKTNSRWGGFLRDVDAFDAPFFGISPREAELMDPQQRLLLEVAWRAIEDSGHKPSDYAGSATGVYIGITANDYAELVRESGRNIEAHTMSGVSRTLVANRLSYLLNLTGPSVAIDTACSSSLVALHHAVSAIRHGQCEAAIVGGVNLLLSPIPYVALSKNGMLSPDGTCKAFGQDANGYVRGEGVIAMMLKPLRQAEADGDPIYAVIRGSAENHGGRTNSLTAPNPNAQTELIVEAWTQANIDPRTISYVEAHGTGTSLGDPIEINGLKRAFDQLYKLADRPFSGQPHCGIGSVKSNVGHLEASAGLAGLLKVVLAMKHQTLPASLHVEALNPYIDLSGTPFYIVSETQRWEPLRDEQNRALPRRAGVSSFGFGGANAHVVVEEYLRAPVADRSAEPQIILLSAKNEERLNVYASNLLDSLTSIEAAGSESLADFAYTLQVGREAMEARLALIVNSFEELRQALTEYVGGQKQTVPQFSGTVKKSLSHIGLLVEGPEGAEYMQIVLRDRKLSKLAQLWIAGVPLDWRLLHQDRKPRRLALPTYPFQKHRYWVTDGVQSERPIVASPVGGSLHPLIDSNESTLEEQVFKKVLRGTEFYLRDHVLGENMIVPGVAYLELARAGGQLASRRGAVRRLKGIVWARPILVQAEAIEMRISYYPDGEAVEFEVTTGSAEQKVLHAQGKVLYEQGAAATAYEPLDLDAIRERCTVSLSASDCYQLFASKGFAYGPSFLSMQELIGNRGEALSRLELPDVVVDRHEEYVLHPSLLDGALQTVLGLSGQTGSADDPVYLPFAIGEVEVVRSLTKVCFAYVTYAAQDHLSGNAVRKYNISIVDERGNHLVRIFDFTTRAYAEPKQADEKQQSTDWQSDPLLAELLQRVANGELDAEEADQLLEVMIDG